MFKRLCFLGIYILSIAAIYGCNSAASPELSQGVVDSTGGGKSVYYLYDSQNPILMQPKVDSLIQIMSENEIEFEIIDMADSDYNAAARKIDVTTIAGLIVSLPYNFNIDKYLDDIHSTKFTILQFGGNYYSNDISISINSKYTGYLIGKKMGEVFLEKKKTDPAVGFYSIENDWKMFEKGFIEGMGEVLPDAYISLRQIVSARGEILLSGGEQDFAKIDGCVAFFCDNYSKKIFQNNYGIKARAGEETGNLDMGDIGISLSIMKEEKLKEVLNQFIEMMQGNQTNESEFKYNAVFDFVIS